MILQTQAQRDRLRLVEDGWYELTKGELWLVQDGPLDSDVDLGLVKLALAMWDEVEAFTSLFDVEKVDIDQRGDEAIAARIAEALALLHYGGRWVTS